MSYRGRREQGCWLVLSQADLSQSREDARSHRPSHASHVSRQQTRLSIVRRSRLQFAPRHQLISHSARHQRQQPLKHHINTETTYFQWTTVRQMLQACSHSEDQSKLFICSLQLSPCPHRAVCWKLPWCLVHVYKRDRPYTVHGCFKIPTVLSW